MKTLPKTVAEIRTYEMPFGVQPEFDSGGVTISSIDSITVTPAGLTIAGAAAVGSSAFFTASVGANGTRYLIDVKVTLSNGAKLEGAGVLSVVNPTLPTV